MGAFTASSFGSASTIVTLFAEILREPERQLAADHTATDDNGVLAHILAALRERILRSDDTAVIAERERLRLRAGGNDERIEGKRFQLPAVSRWLK